MKTIHYSDEIFKKLFVYVKKKAKHPTKHLGMLQSAYVG